MTVQYPPKPFTWGKSRSLEWPVDDDGNREHDDYVSEFVYDLLPELKEVYAFTRFGGDYVICLDADDEEMDLAVDTNLALLFEHIWRDEPGFGVTVQAIWRERSDEQESRCDNETL